MDFTDLLARSGGPDRPALSMRTVRVSQASPLVIDYSGAVLDGAVSVLKSYVPEDGDMAVLIRQGGLAVLIGKV